MDYLNYMEPCYDEREINAVTNYMNSGAWLTEYKKTRSFESQLAGYTESKYCSVMSNGTVTLVASLMAMGIGYGDEVIVPDFTMSATSHAVCLVGATPVFVDVEPETLCMDFDRMQEAVTLKTKAVILVDLNGRYPKRFQEIVEYCKERKLWLVEDAAQALGSSFQGKMLGTFGDVGSYSFSMPKIITTGQGGAVVTDNKYLYERLLKIRDFGRDEAGSDHYIMLGSNYKFTDIQAVIGIEQVKKLGERIPHKKAICKKYDQLLTNISGIEIFSNDYNDTAPCFYEVLCEDRDGLFQYLKSKNIGARKFYPPLHSEPAYGLEGSYPVTENISARGLWLPSSVKLTDDKIDYICSAVRSFYGVNGGTNTKGDLLSDYNKKDEDVMRDCVYADKAFGGV